MSDADHNDEFDKAFEGFGDNPATVVTPPTATPPATDPANPTPPTTPPAPVVEPPKPAEEPKKDDATPPAEPPKPEEATPPADPAKKPEEGAEPPKAPETPPAPEEQAKPLTEEGILKIINDAKNEDRTSAQALENQTKEVLEAYYPEGLSNTLVDEATGKELKTPQDVVDVTNGQMDIEKATQWLMNEQFKLDREVDKIKSDAAQVAETTLKFKKDSIDVLQRYEPLFKAYPHLQQKVWDSYKPLVKADEQKQVILSAPDMRQYYDTMLEPYRMAVELGQQQPATAPTDPAPPPAPAPAPGAEDRLDETGDGGPAPVNDPNDFAQQVTKELNKGE